MLVVGAGIHGACIAREASLRGMSVAIIDRSDFGAATSANSLKIIHGGLRYLQKLDIGRIKESVRERRTLMRLAPHLVHPLPVVIPTYGRGLRSKTALRIAFGLTNLIAPEVRGRDDVPDPLPESRVMSREELFELFPILSRQNNITGGAMWYDGQVYNTERLTLAFVRSAVELGAVAVNYVEIRRLMVHNRRVTGATVRDVLSGDEFDVKSHIVINAAGPWIHRVLGGTGSATGRQRPLLCKAWNVVVKSPLHATHALGVAMVGPDRRMGPKSRMLFATPWRGRSILGTMYAPGREEDDARVTDHEVERLIEEINRALPGAQVSAGDVIFRHGGFLPVQHRDEARGIDELADRYRIIDHARQDRLEGVLSVFGVKYTSARAVAEKVIKMVCRRLGYKSAGKNSCQAPVDGGDVSDLGALEQALRTRLASPLSGFAPSLARDYGSRATEVIQLCREQEEDATPVSATSVCLRAQVRYAVRTEMGVKLADIVMRRTGLGTLGHPGEPALRTCASIMAQELGWTAERTRAEIAEVVGLFDMLGPPPSARS